MKTIEFCSGYFVRSDGKIFNNKTGKLKEEMHITNQSGYEIVNINGRVLLIHRIVAECFIPNPENKPIVNHKDGNKTNNHVENLEWCTNSENVQHAWDTGLAHKRKTDEQVDLQKQLAEKLQLLRLQKGVSQLEVSKYLGLTVGAYQNYETGRRKANYETLTKLAIFFGVTTDYLLGLEEKKDPIETIASTFKLSNASKAILAAYLYMDEADRARLFEAVQKLTNAADKNQ